MEFPQKWREKSIKDNILLSDILYGYAVEDVMRRIERSSFKEFLWLTNETAVGEEAYKKTTKESLEFLYVESQKKNFRTENSAGDAFSKELLEFLIKELFYNIEETDIYWNCTVGETENGATLLLDGIYMDMHVPITVRIAVARIGAQRPKSQELKLLFEEKKKCIYFSYSKEEILSEAIFEIMRKLELISDMEAYDLANEIIKSHSISGRHIIEDLKAMGKKEPKVIYMKRLEQISSYKNYGYMKKKWQQYVRNHKTEGEEWEDVIERIVGFISPLWKALCENEIFFDDWMPELGRFLG